MSFMSPSVPKPQPLPTSPQQADASQAPGGAPTPSMAPSLIGGAGRLTRKPNTIKTSLIGG